MFSIFHFLARLFSSVYIEQSSPSFANEPSFYHLNCCSLLAPSVSCHVRLSFWSRRGSRVSKCTVNFRPAVVHYK